MELLYISALSSERMINDLYQKTKKNPGFAVQKFSRLLVKGLILNNANVISLSNPPITRESGLFCVFAKEFENGVKFRYIPFVNIPFLKNICVFVYTFLYVLFWGLFKKKDKAILCDVLCISSCMAALIASKINRTKSVAIVTDIYSQMVGQATSSLTNYSSKQASRLQNWYTKLFSEYVLLTEEMNEIVNPNKRPYVVMEGLCDNSISDEMINTVKKNQSTTILYAGGIEEEYGIKMLVEAFRKIPYDNISLVLYGHGSYVENIEQISKIDYRIEYRGIAPNTDVIKAELEATLLVNPRFSDKDFTKYSFPSKNLEYMVSGTPLLTTKLPGIPKEYYPYVYLFEEETVDGFTSKLIEVMSKNKDELHLYGQSARQFVLEKKNNIVQTNKIINLLC